MHLWKSQMMCFSQLLQRRWSLYGWKFLKRFLNRKLELISFFLELIEIVIVFLLLAVIDHILEALGEVIIIKRRISSNLSFLHNPNTNSKVLFALKTAKTLMQRSNPRAFFASDDSFSLSSCSLASLILASSTKNLLASINLAWVCFP